MFVRERFNPVPMAANAAYIVNGTHMGGFLAKTAGTISVTAKDPLGLTDVLIVDTIPIAAGSYTPIPIVFPAMGGTVQLAGGASGTLMV